MPIYEYRCKDCGKEFEYQQRMSEPAKTDCEACSGSLEKLISRSSFHLKGSGWYKDLYSSAKPSSGTGDSGSSSGSSDSGSSSSSTPSSSASSTPSTSAAAS